MTDMYKNHEGYADPTAGKALSRVMRENKMKQNKHYSKHKIKKVYVASKYKGDVDSNVNDAINYCRLVISQGYMPIASHLLYPQILDDENPKERKLGLKFGLALLRICDEVWVFGSLSQGMEGEIKEAKRLNKKIKFIKEGLQV